MLDLYSHKLILILSCIIFIFLFPSFLFPSFQDLVDIQHNTDIGSNSRIDSLNPKQLYNIGWLSSERTSLYWYRRIEDFHLPDNSYEIIPLISPQTGRQLQNQQGRYVHMGLITIGVRSLVRHMIGARALIVLHDSRF